MKLLALLLLAVATTAHAEDCDSLKDQYATSLDAVQVARAFVRGELEKIGIKARNPLIEAKIPISVVDSHNGPASGFSRLRFGDIQAFFVDGRVLHICAGFREGACSADAEARFSWDLTRADRTNAYGEVIGYSCTLRSFPTPFPRFLNASTRQSLFELADPSGLLVTETH